MELQPSSGLFNKFAYQSPEAMVNLLEEAVSFMRFRAERLRLEGATRPHAGYGRPARRRPHRRNGRAHRIHRGPRPQEAGWSLRCSCSSRRAGRRASSWSLLSRTPARTSSPSRDLFPSRIALRLLEDVQVDMVLGRSSRLRGAECDQIAASLPGIGYVVLEGVREPVRVRAALVTDGDVADTVARFRPAAPAEPVGHLGVGEELTMSAKPPTAPSDSLLGAAGVESAERRSGGCARPVRLRGSKNLVNVETGEVRALYASADELDART